MTVVEFSMSGAVRGKGRPRATVRGGFAQMYTDEKTRLYERSVRDLSVRAMAGRSPFMGPLSVSLQLRLGLPKSMSKRQRGRVLAQEEPYFGVVDCDNAGKALLDAMNGSVYLDDRQVTRLWIVKVPSENPGVDVRVEALAEPS